MIATAQVIAQDQIARAADTGTMGEFRTALAGGTTGPDPKNWFYVSGDVLQQYQVVISGLEAQVASSRAMVEQLMALQGIGVVSEPSSEMSEPMNAASVALINSLLCTVPESNYYKEEDEA